MSFKNALLALAASLTLAAGSASAANISFAGNLADANDVLLFNFNLAQTSSVTLRTYSYAGGTNAVGQQISAGGFDPILALFDGSGTFIDQNDDGDDGTVAADPISGFAWDTFLQATLMPGTYTVAVMAYSNFAAGSNLLDGFQHTGSIGDRTSFFAFDVLNAERASQIGGGTAISESASLALLGAGLLGLTFVTRRSRKAA